MKNFLLRSVNLWILGVVVLAVSCKNPTDPNNFTDSKTVQKVSPSVVAPNNLKVKPQVTYNNLVLPVPVFKDSTNKHKTITLLQLEKQQRPLTINSRLEFETFSQIPNIKEIKLNVRSDCYANAHTGHPDSVHPVFTHIDDRPLSQYIPIIELLPETILLPSHQPSSFKCKLQLIATKGDIVIKNGKLQGGPAHTFYIDTTINNLTTNHLVKINNYTKDTPKASATWITSTFPFLLSKNVKFSYIHILPNKFSNKNINSLKLYCGDKKISTYKMNKSYDKEKIIPLSKLVTQNWLQKNNPFPKEIPTQRCRILAYRDRTIVATSLVFNLFDKEIKPVQLTLKSAFTTVTEWVNLTTSNPLVKKHQKTPLYSYIIKNPNPYPVSILLEDIYLNKTNTDHTVQMYWISFTNRVFYTVQTFSPYLMIDDEIPPDIIMISNGGVPQGPIPISSLKQIKNTTIITLQAHEEQSLLVFQNTTYGSFKTTSIHNTQLANNHEYIKLKNNEHLTRLLGIIIQPPDIKMYQILSPDLKFLFNKQNILLTPNVPHSPIISYENSLHQALDKNSKLYIPYSATNESGKIATNGYLINHPSGDYIYRTYLSNKGHEDLTLEISIDKNAYTYNMWITVHSSLIRQANNIIGEILFPSQPLTQ